MPFERSKISFPFERLLPFLAVRTDVAVRSKKTIAVGTALAVRSTKSPAVQTIANNYFGHSLGARSTVCHSDGLSYPLQS